MASVTESDESFTISNGVLTAYSGADEVSVIPEGVTEIKASVFAGNTTITSVIIPKTVTSIGNYAFL